MQEQLCKQLQLGPQAQRSPQQQAPAGELARSAQRQPALAQRSQLHLLSLLMLIVPPVSTTEGPGGSYRKNA
ncbi:MAG TPA: hypothetical protein VJU61_22490, partial [Polyangiaceae bacterium]|nr:hypothetical protein [Polyangiaceae bacterium]